MADRIMAHLVAFYPDKERTLEVARALTDGGAAYLEVQFPFSEPTADGPVIQRACARALENGFSVDEGFRLLERIRGITGVPIFVMSYANVVFRRGVEHFVRRCREAGAQGVIVPDLPPDSDEGLFASARKAGLDAVPVVAPTISDARIRLIGSLKPAFIYAALRKGITGAATAIGGENLAFLSRLRPVGAKILAGFGISERGQVEALSAHVHACIVGSAFIAAATEGAAADDAETGGAGAASDGSSIYGVVRAKIESLI
jgi:tryptophan synthase alpha chain